MHLKHVSSELVWDEMVDIGCCVYNIVPNEHSKEIAFFLIFGRNAYIPLVQLLNPKIGYMGENMSLLALDALKRYICTSHLQH